jgi:hypothetical protein
MELILLAVAAGFKNSMTAKPLPASGLVTRCVNEFIFPVGCSVVLFAAQKLGEKAK